MHQQEDFSCYIKCGDSHNNLAAKILPQTLNINLTAKEMFLMSKNNIVVPEAKDALERFKMEAAAEVGVNLKQGYNGDLTSRQAGSVGGQMVKKMIESYERGLK